MSPGAGAGRRARPRAVALLPAILTLGNIFLGFFSMVKALEGSFLVASVCLVFAAVLDKFDGLVARKTGTDSDFGRELDSLADVISFGVAPALLAYTWGLRHVPKLGWAACFLFLMCATLRLARFNVQTASVDKRWFVGLPSPAAAAVPVTLVLAWSAWHPARPQLGSEEPFLAGLLLVLTTAAAFLMVSTFRYFAFKELRVGRQQRHLVLLGIGLAIALLAAWPPLFLLALATTYAASGPVLKLTSFLSRRRPAPGGAESDGAEPDPDEAGGAGSAPPEEAP